MNTPTSISEKDKSKRLWNDCSVQEKQIIIHTFIYLFKKNNLQSSTLTDNALNYTKS